MTGDKRTNAGDKVRKILKVSSLFFLFWGLLAARNLVEKLAFIREPGFFVACLIVSIFGLVMLVLSFFLYFKPQWFVDNFREILLLVASVCLCLVLAEGGLRLFHIIILRGDIESVSHYFPDPPPGASVLLGAMIRPHANRRIVYTLRPNLDVFFKGARVVTNSTGWRGGEYQKKKAENTIRIVGIGDSIMFGWGVDENKRYMDVLEWTLKENFPEYNWEILVFAVPGYNLAMEVEVLKEQALEYDPDVIVYGFVRNDSCLPDFLNRKTSFFSARPMIIDYFNPHLQQNVLFQGRTIGGKLFWKVCDEREVPKEYKDLAGEKTFLRAEEDLADIGTARDIPVVIFSKKKYGPANKIVHENIYYFDAGDEMEEYARFHKKSALVISKKDPHPSVIGHKIMAEALYRQLLNGGVIQDIMAKRRFVISSPTAFEPVIPK